MWFRLFIPFCFLPDWFAEQRRSMHVQREVLWQSRRPGPSEPVTLIQHRLVDSIDVGVGYQANFMLAAYHRWHVSPLTSRDGGYWYPPCSLKVVGKTNPRLFTKHVRKSASPVYNIYIYIYVYIQRKPRDGSHCQTHMC